MAIENVDFFSAAKTNIWSMLSGLVKRNTLLLPNAGAPVNGTTFAGRAGIGSLLLDYTNGVIYVNAGTLASPVWVNVSGAVSGNAGLGMVGNAKATYDFSVDAGAISTLIPTNSPTLPIGAIILGGTIDITTQLTSGGAATIALGTSAGSSTTSLKGATAVASWTVGQLALVPIFTAATYVKLTAAGRPNVTIATAALTAGKFDINLLYVVGN
jgi:hypothetical protein